MQRFNPFRPNSIVSPGMFSGRYNELCTLEKILFQTKNGNPQHFLIQGERGIGKSSLLFYLQMVAKGEISTFDNTTFNFLTINIELEPSNTYFDIIKKIGSAFNRAIRSHKNHEEKLKAVWDFVKGWEVAGVKYSSAFKEVPVEPQDLIDELTFTISETISKLGNDFDGLLILVDEADKAPAEAHLGEFCKLFTEKLTKLNCFNVCLGLSGLPELLNKLRQSHESSPRVFEILSLAPLLEDERKGVIKSGLKAAKEKNKVETQIETQAEDWISLFSEGYPHFIQQFSYCAFDHDSDDLISLEDVIVGAYKENGAFEQLGRKYFHELYFDKINSDEYRAVLQTMAQNMDSWITRQEIKEKIPKISDSTLNNAISALKKRNIIITMDGKKGVYRLPSKSFATWIKSYATAHEAVQAKKKRSQLKLQIPTK